MKILSSREKIPGQMESISGRLDKVKNLCTVQGTPGQLAGINYSIVNICRLL